MYNTALCVGPWCDHEVDKAGSHGYYLLSTVVALTTNATQRKCASVAASTAK